MVKVFTRRDRKVLAIQLTADTYQEVEEFIFRYGHTTRIHNEYIIVTTDDSINTLAVGDYVCLGEDTKLRYYKEDQFKLKYH